jgi:hypothetical protein
VGVSRKLRQYASGILLLLLAGFILASVSYIISIIPETAIPNTQSMMLVYNRTSYSSSGSNPYQDSYLVQLDYPPSGKIYVIVLRDASNHTYPRNFSRMEVVAGSTTYNVSVSFNGTHYITTWDKNITWVFIYYYGPQWYPYPLQIYLADYSFSISNKLILSFISWIAGILLVIQALHKFDIWV